MDRGFGLIANNGSDLFRRETTSLKGINTGAYHGLRPSAALRIGLLRSAMLGAADTRKQIHKLLVNKLLVNSRHCSLPIGANAGKPAENLLGPTQKRP